MYARLLQDWVTIRAGSAKVVTQGEDSWLDLADFLDVVAFIETKNFNATGGTLFAALQTSPTKDEVLFQSMNDITATTGTPLALGLQTFILLRDTALCPLARWFRWQLVAGAATAFEATFRIWIAANAPGGFGDTVGARNGDGVSSGGGGPAWTDAPANAVSSPPPAPNLGKISQDMNRVVLGKDTGPVTFGQTSASPPAHYHWWDNTVKIAAPNKNDWKHRVSRFQPPIPGVRLPWVSPEVKKSST